MPLGDLRARLRERASRYISQNDNADLLFGGTSPQEFQALSSIVAQSRGPNFAAFLAGVSGANLAEQQARQRGFDQSIQLSDQITTNQTRDANNTLTLNRSETEDINQRTLQRQNESNIRRTDGLTTNTAAATAGTNIDNVTRGQRNVADIANVSARTAGVDANTATANINNLTQAERNQLTILAGRAGIRLTGANTANVQSQTDTRNAALPFVAPAAAADVNATTAQTANVQSQTQTRDAQLPFVPQQAAANISATVAGAANTGVRTQTAQAELPFVAPAAEAQIANTESQVELREQQIRAARYANLVEPGNNALDQFLTYNRAIAAGREPVPAQTQASIRAQQAAANVPGNLSRPNFGGQQGVSPTVTVPGSAVPAPVGSQGSTAIQPQSLTPLQQGQNQYAAAQLAQMAKGLASGLITGAEFNRAEELAGIISAGSYVNADGSSRPINEEVAELTAIYSRATGGQ